MLTRAVQMVRNCYNLINLEQMQMATQGTVRHLKGN